jgi:hypothetical protein
MEDDEKVAALRGLLARHGEEVLDDPARFDSLLKDTVLSPPERSAVFGAMKLGIPQRLREQPGTELPAAVIARLSDRLSQEMALRPDAARAGVEIWARALGRDVPAGVPLSSSPPPPPPPSQQPPSGTPSWFAASTLGAAVSTPPPWATRSATDAPTAEGTPLPPGKKVVWFSKIETREQAIQIVRIASVFYFVAAGIQVLLGLALNRMLLIDAVVFIVGGIVLRQLNSRIAAVVLLVDACVGVLLTLTSGGLPFLAALGVWVGVRATDATFKLNRQPVP